MILLRFANPLNFSELEKFISEWKNRSSIIFNFYKYIRKKGKKRDREISIFIGKFNYEN